MSSLTRGLSNISAPVPSALQVGLDSTFYWNDAFLRPQIAAALGDATRATRANATGFSISSDVRKFMWHRTFQYQDYGLVGSRSPIAHIVEGGAGKHTMTAGGIAAERRSVSRKKKEGGGYDYSVSTNTRRKRGGKKAMTYAGAKHPFARTRRPSYSPAAPFLAPAAAMFPRELVTALRRRFPRV